MILNQSERSASVSQYYFPPVEKADDRWETVSPSDAGWDADALEKALGFAAERHSTAFLILYKGRILVERYWREWNAHTAAPMYSASKSAAAFLIGQAQEEGLLDINRAVSEYLGRGWSKASLDQESQITVRHLLTMTSGLNDKLEFVAAPGTVWHYNTPAYYATQFIVEKVSGLTKHDFAAGQIYDRLGMHDTDWKNWWMSTSARDMARFGLLNLAQGTWRGTALLKDRAYFAAMQETSQELNPSYGYLWWLNGKDGWRLPLGSSGEGPLIPAAPSDLVAALGAADKKIYVVPSLDLVVVRHGEAAGAKENALSSFDNLLWEKITAAMPQ